MSGVKRQMEPWYWNEKSGRVIGRDFDPVGLDPKEWNALFMVSPIGIRDKRKPPEIFVGERLGGFCPLAVSLPTMEAGTVTFSLARLPRR